MENAVISNKTTIISIAGGYNDFLVPSYLSDFHSKLNQSLYAVVSMLVYYFNFFLVIINILVNKYTSSMVTN